VTSAVLFSAIYYQREISGDTSRVLILQSFLTDLFLCKKNEETELVEKV